MTSFSPSVALIPPPHPSPQGGGCPAGGRGTIDAKTTNRHLPLEGGGWEGVTPLVCPERAHV